VLLVPGIGEDREEPLVPAHPAAVLGRARARAVDTDGKARRVDVLCHALHDDLVEPVVAEVVAPAKASANPRDGVERVEVLGRAVLELVRDARVPPLATVLEQVEVGVVPPHGGDQDVVEVVEPDRLRNDDAPPNGKRRADEFDPELPRGCGGVVPHARTVTARDGDAPGRDGGVRPGPRPAPRNRTSSDTSASTRCTTRARCRSFAASPRTRALPDRDEARARGR